MYLLTQLVNVEPLQFVFGLVPAVEAWETSLVLDLFGGVLPTVKLASDGGGLFVDVVELWKCR